MKWVVIEKEDSNKSMELNKDMGKKPVFLFLFLEGCGPCMHTKKTWDTNKMALEDKYKNMDDLIVARVNQSNMKYLDKITSQPLGFPSLRFMDTAGKVEEYEESGIEPMDRSSASFMKWIESRTSKSKGVMKGAMKGGKWSAKYKKSINCKRPKGSSQKQHCKYGRNKTRKNKSRKNERKHKML